MTQKNMEGTPELTRKGSRRNSGADTPSGPNTERSSIPAKRERGDEDPNEIMPGTHPATVKEIEQGAER